VLSHFITAPSITKQNIGLALAAYDQVRLEPIWRLMHCSRRQGLVYGLRDESSGYSSPPPETLLEIIKENTEWILDWDVKQDIQRGLEWIARREE
jgi:hypothetical protein